MKSFMFYNDEALAPHQNALEYTINRSRGALLVPSDIQSALSFAESELLNERQVEGDHKYIQFLIETIENLKRFDQFVSSHKIDFMGSPDLLK